jgi:hypothetical protein
MARMWHANAEPHLIRSDLHQPPVAWYGSSIYGEDMARLDSGSDRRPACSACAADQIYVRGRIRRAVVRAGFCREPGKALRLCESHLAQLRRALPEGGVWVVGRYQRDSSEATKPDSVHD